MTTLPPEDQNGRGPVGQPAGDPAPTAPPAPPAAPQVPQTPPAPPQAPPAPPQFQPQQPQAPQQPPAPQYSAPQYSAPQGGQTPPPGGPQQPQGAYAQPVADPTSNITLNYWLSVFFTWIPALIFFFVDKDKGDQRLYVFQRENLNFSLLRTGLYLVIIIASFIPYVNLVVVPLVWIAQVVAFVFHIIAAVKAPEAFRRGEQPGFIVNLPLIK